MQPPPFDPNVDAGGKGAAQPPPPYPGVQQPPMHPAPQNYGYPQPAPGAAAYPPPGAYPPHAGSPMQQQGPYPQPATTTVVTMPTTSSTTVVMTGNCPRCHIGNLISETSGAMLVMIIVLVILFFPIGLLYLLCLGSANVHRCPNCGYSTG